MPDTHAPRQQSLWSGRETFGKCIGAAMGQNVKREFWSQRPGGSISLSILPNSGLWSRRVSIRGFPSFCTFNRGREFRVWRILGNAKLNNDVRIQMRVV